MALEWRSGMTYFIINREDITESMWENCEMTLLSAMGRCCGQKTVLAFLEENIPEGLSGGMTHEEFLAAATAETGWPIYY